MYFSKPTTNFKPDMSKADILSNDQQRAYELITEENGLVQSQLWKTLDEDSRTGSRLATDLAEKGLIEREPTTHNGQRTYLLKPTDEPSLGDTQPESREEAVASEEPGDEDLTNREEHALELIRENGGMYQSEFWKAFDVSSRTGSRIATNLEDKEQIRRVETIHKGRRTYYLRPMPRDLDFSLLMAGDMISPFAATKDDPDALTSKEFTEWLLRLTDEES